MKLTPNDRVFTKEIRDRPILYKPEECGPTCTCYRYGPCRPNCSIPKARVKKESEGEK